MKRLIATTAMLVLFTSIASAEFMPNAPTSINIEDRRGGPAEIRAHDYRVWSAEQMIYRIADKLVRVGKACDRAEWIIGQRLSEKCIANVLSANPVLAKIREIAAGGDPVQWAKLIDVVHQFEAEIEGPLNILERR